MKFEIQGLEIENSQIIVVLFKIPSKKVWAPRYELVYCRL